MYLPALREGLQHQDSGFRIRSYDLGQIGGQVFPYHWHDEWEAILVTRGELTVLSGPRTETVKEGESIWIGRGQLHSGTTTSSDFRCRPIVFHPRFLMGTGVETDTSSWILDIDRGKLELPFVVSNSQPVGKEINQTLSLAAGRYDARAAGWDLVVRGSLLIILGTMAQASLFTAVQTPKPHVAREDERIRKVINAMETEWNRHVSVEEFAQVACLSRSAFTRFFRAQTGESPAAYFLRIRMTRAAQLLEAGTLTVTEVAGQLGYDNLSHFTRTFVHYQGRLPSQASGQRRA